MIILGGTYRDKITGFQGIATGFVRYITGCNQVLLAPPVDRDGKIVESQWFDDQRLVDMGSEVIQLSEPQPPGVAVRGFDKQAPKR